jgi:hypothetical protein
MSVKTADRHLSKVAYLNDARKLVLQVLVLTRPSKQKANGKYNSPGALGSQYLYSAFGASILDSAKRVHGNCFAASEIEVRTKEDLDKVNKFFDAAIGYCDSILRELDLCIFVVQSEKKRNSYWYLADLARACKLSIEEHQRSFRGKPC